MLLALDIGNTSSVFALYDGKDQAACWRIPTGEINYDMLLEHDITAAVVASVVPTALESFEGFCVKRFGFAPLVANYKNIPIEVLLDDCSQAGADRLINAFAVVHEYKKMPAIVIDFGTATTFDVIDARGAYAGGAIATGASVSVNALSSAAACIPSIDINGAPRNAIGKNTIDAMKSGVYWGYIGTVERIVSEITKELNEKPFVIATGGLCSVFAPHLPFLDAVDKDLTIKGLVGLWCHFV